MTHEECIENVLYGLKHVDKAIFEVKLLEMAREIASTKEYSQENFDRLGLLVDCFLSYYLCSIDEVQGVLMKTKKYLRSSSKQKTE